MPATAAQPTLTHAQMDLGDDLRVLEMSMIHEVAAHGGRDNNAILDFQMFVNQNLPQLNATLQVLFPGTSARFSRLAEDGDWGQYTASALAGGLAMTLDGRQVPPPPTRSVGVPTWYAQNQAVLDSLVTGAAGQTIALSTPAPVPRPPQTDQEAVQQALDSGRVITQVTATPVMAPASSAGPSQIVETIDETPKAITESHMVTDDRQLLALEVQTDFTEPDTYFSSTVVAARPGSRVPWIAVLLGAGTLGGVLWWWTKKRKRRAA